MIDHEKWRRRISAIALLVGIFGLVVMVDALILGSRSAGYENKIQLGLILAICGGAVAGLAAK